MSDEDNDRGDEPRTFTQEDVDRIVKDRLARVKAEPPADYDDLKAKAAKLDELEQANKTELEKAIARAEQAEQVAKAAADRARRADIKSAVTSAATVAGAVDPDAVLALLGDDAVTVGDDGQVTGADEAVKALLESKPYLVGKPANSAETKPAPSGDGGPRGGGDGKPQLTRADLARMTPDEIEQARLDGRLTELLTGAA